MYSNHSITIDKVEHSEDYVRHIFRDILAGPNSTFYLLVERTKYDWETERELPELELINNATEKYNNMLEAKNGPRHTPRMLKFLQ